MELKTIKGGIHEDVRGILYYVNDANPGFYRRFYIIKHPDTAIVRAWQGHKIEEKAFYVINGGFIIAAVQPHNFDTPSENENPEFFKLTSNNQLFLKVLGGCYTGIKALSPDSTLLVLSSLDLSESKKDDFRQPADKWVNWNNLNLNDHD